MNAALAARAGRAHLAVVAVVVAVAGVACIDPTIPDGALISCAKDADCPDGFVCQEARSLCVLQKNLDEKPPVLTGTPTLDPVVGNAGTVFTLTFDVSEALSADPDVSVDIGAASSAPFTLDAEASDAAALHYVLTYTASGAEAPDRPSPVTIKLVDKADNPSADLSGGVITFDFAPPALTSPSLSATLIGPGDVLTATFTPTEDLAAGGAAVALVPVDGGDVIDMVDAGDGSFVYDDAGDEADGDYSVEATLTNLSGNTAGGLLVGRVTVDNTPPAVQAGATIRTVPDVELRGDDVLDARADTVLEVVFVASEPLAGSPRVFVSCGGAERDMERTGDVTSPIVFVERLAGGLDTLPEGACDVLADLADAAGNQALGAPVLAPAFDLDVTAPLAPDVDTPDAVVYRRVPWGDDATGGAKRFTVDGLAGAAEPFARVAVYETEDAPPEDAVGHVDADGTGAFSLVLNPVDRAELFVSQIDPAGNEGPRARVRDIEWVATMGGKVPGSSFVNPHTFQSRSILTDALVQGAVVELGDQAAAGDGVVAVTTGASTWENITEGAGRRNPDIERPMLAYDPARSRLFLFGGQSCVCGAGNGLAPCIDTFARAGAHWSTVTIADPEGDGSPVAEEGGAMVFDVSRGVSVLFGTGGAADVWELDGTSWRHACDAACAANGPSPRAQLAAAYDPVRRRSVVFGGKAGAGLTDETWEWDGHAWRAACVDATCTKPPARAAHGMIYDDALRAVVVFGGDGDGNIDGDGRDDGGLLNDIWSFDGASWTELCTDAACAATRPTARDHAGFAYDRVRNQAVIFGGLSGAAGTCGGDPNGQVHALLSDTVLFDGARFTTVTPADPEGDGDPTPRRSPGMAWDPRQQRVVMVSGVDDEPCATLECTRTNAEDTWEWDGTSWHSFADVTEPTDNAALSAAFDPQRDEVLMVGTGGAIFRFGERWRSSGTFTTVHARVARESGRLMVFGGLTTGNALSSFTGFAAAGNFAPFLQICVIGQPCPPTPPARSLQAMAESPTGGALMFGGSNSASESPFNGTTGDTWQLNGSWAQLCTGCTTGTTSPPARMQSAMAFDSDRGVDVMFGGQPGDAPTPLDDTWEWDGAAWQQRSPAHRPPARTQETLTYDEARHRAILFGGFAGGFFGVNCGNGKNECTDLWEWDGSDWSQPLISDVHENGTPGGRFGHAMAFSPRLQKSVMFGGGDAETWLYDAGGHDRPGQVMAAAFAAAGTAGDETIVDVSARFDSGGLGDNDAAGARLFVWDEDGWRALADNSAPAGAPADVVWDDADTPLDATDTGGTALPRLFFGTERTLFFAVAPATENGGRAGFGEVDTDAAEVTVKYRLP